MKYTELKINKLLIDENYLIYDYVERENEINIHAKSKNHKCICPKCGQESNEFHATYERKIQTVPIEIKTTYINVIAYQYNCKNENCAVKVFAENLSFVPSSQVRSNTLTSLILAISIFMSSMCTSMILALIGVKVSHDTINRLYDNLSIEDEPDIEAVGIDDVAIRKGRKYATAIYDLNDHHLIALLDGRDSETLKEWLKGHKKIKLVARDRASAYAKAINEILPDCIQVADRFHLLQNLIERMKDIFKEELPKEIFIKDGRILEKAPEKEITLKISPNSKELEKYDYDNELPVDGNGELIIYDNKKRDLDSKQYKTLAENRDKKQKMIQEIQERCTKLEHKDIKIIEKEFSIGPVTAKKYINMTKEEIDALNSPKCYKKRKTVADDYLNMIYKMLRDKIEPAAILSYTLKSGYTGNLNTMESYIKLFAKNNFNIKLCINWAYKSEYPKDITVIKRNQILLNITTKDAKKEKNDNIEKYLELIKEKYKVVVTLQKAYDEFHEVIMGKEPSKLEDFIDKYDSSLIEGFIDGIKKDIEPVKNAISSDVSSGFVEGNNNKFKLIKRILYGRAGLVKLFKKSYVAFFKKLDSFSLQSLINSNTST